LDHVRTTARVIGSAVVRLANHWSRSTTGAAHGPQARGDCDRRASARTRASLRPAVERRLDKMRRHFRGMCDRGTAPRASGRQRARGHGHSGDRSGIWRVTPPSRGRCGSGTRCASRGRHGTAPPVRRVRAAGCPPATTHAALALLLTLGVGATTAMVALVDAVLLRPVAVRDPRSLVVVAPAGTAPGGEVGPQRWSYPFCRELRDRTASHDSPFAGVLAFFRFSANASRRGDEMLFPHPLMALDGTRASG
jgi:hypothetical protein